MLGSPKTEGGAVNALVESLAKEYVRARTHLQSPPGLLWCSARLSSFQRDTGESSSDGEQTPRAPIHRQSRLTDTPAENPKPAKPAKLGLGQKLAKLFSRKSTRHDLPPAGTVPPSRGHEAQAAAAASLQAPSLLPDSAPVPGPASSDSDGSQHSDPDARLTLSNLALGGLDLDPALGLDLALLLGDDASGRKRKPSSPGSEPVASAVGPSLLDQDSYGLLLSTASAAPGLRSGSGPAPPCASGGGPRRGSLDSQTQHTRTGGLRPSPPPQAPGLLDGSSSGLGELSGDYSASAFASASNSTLAFTFASTSVSGPVSAGALGRRSTGAGASPCVSNRVLPHLSGSSSTFGHLPDVRGRFGLALESYQSGLQPPQQAPGRESQSGSLVATPNASGDHSCRRRASCTNASGPLEADLGRSPIGPPSATALPDSQASSRSRRASLHVGFLAQAEPDPPGLAAAAPTSADVGGTPRSRRPSWGTGPAPAGADSPLSAGPDSGLGGGVTRSRRPSQGPLSPTPLAPSWLQQGPTLSVRRTGPMGLSAASGPGPGPGRAQVPPLGPLPPLARHGELSARFGGVPPFARASMPAESSSGGRFSSVDPRGLMPVGSTSAGRESHTDGPCSAGVLSSAAYGGPLCLSPFPAAAPANTGFSGSINGPALSSTVHSGPVSAASAAATAAEDAACLSASAGAAAARRVPALSPTPPPAGQAQAHTWRAERRGSNPALPP